MDNAPTTRGRHAWKWLLAASLLLPLASLQVARSRAASEWEEVLAHLQDSGWHISEYHIGGLHGEVESGTVTVRDNYLMTYRGCTVSRGPCVVDVKQYRKFFGVRLEARLGTMFEVEPEEVEAARAVFAAVDIELIVEP